MHKLTSAPSFRFIFLLPRLVLLMAQNAAVGGQAVMDGVMMRGPSNWAVAIRRYDGSIIQVHRHHVAIAKRHRWARLPVLRGVVALGDSLVIGFKALSVSAHYAAEGIEQRIAEEEAAKERDRSPAADADGAANEAPAPMARVIPLPTAGATGVLAPAGAMVERDAGATSASPPAAEGDAAEEDGSNPDSLSKLQIAIAFTMAIGFSILLFKITPVLLTGAAGFDTTDGIFVLIESSLRISIFMGYLALIGLMPDMKRVFQYHSAEHKAINAWEHGLTLDPKVVNEQSRIHVRCGTAFMLWVFVVAIAVFSVFGHFVQPTLAEVILSRILFLPLIAGISFELIKFAGRYPDSRFLRTLLAPGLWMQYLTTRECTDEQCEVAVASLESVLRLEFPEMGVDEARDELTRDDDEAVQVMA